MSKIIKAVFGGSAFARTEKVFQWDGDDKLVFVGIDLPAAYEVHFANSLTGESKKVLGNSDGVMIPPEYFVPGSSIFAWVWINGETSGYTKYQVTIPIYARAQPSDAVPTPQQKSALDQAIEALNAATEEIPEEINAALAAAKASGEFDGRDGATGPSGADGVDGQNGSSIWTVAAEDAHGGLIRIADLVGRTGLTPAKNDLILDGDWNIYRIDLVGRSTVSATRFGNVGEGGGASGVFVAQYDVSTADEIYEASTGGNACILTYAFPGGIYYLSWLGEVQNITQGGTVVEKSAVFTAVDGDEKTTIRVTGSTWFSPSTVKYARSASPTFTGVPKAPTAEAGTNSTQIATTAFVTAAIQAALENFTPGQTISEELKQALLQLARNVAYIDAKGETYYQDLYDALYPPAVLASIQAIFTQGSTVIYNTDSLDVLKPLLTVTAVYDDGSTETVPAADYTLSGTLATGISTITASYQGKTATFQVVVTAAPMAFAVTNNLTGCSTSNSAAAVMENEPYSAVITPAAGYTLTGASVVITMAGSNITASAYSGGVINIARVTGALVISIVAQQIVLSSISASYTQSGVVYNTDTLDSLKADLVVTAAYSDGTSTVLAADAYTLSGTLTAGTSTITVSYGGKTTTFTVAVTARPTLSSISAVYAQSGTVYTTDTLDSLKADLVVTAHYSDSSTHTVPATDYVLSGTLTVGTSTITVSYGGKATTFSVTVSEQGLPSGYSKVEYVASESSSASGPIVVTGLTLSGVGDCVIEAGLMCTNTSGSSGKFAIATRANNSSTVTTGLAVSFPSGWTEVSVYVGDSAKITANGGESIKNVRQDIVATVTSTSASITNGDASNTIQTTPRAYNVAPLSLFGTKKYNIGQIGNPFSGRIYYVRVTEDGTLKMNLIPCVRDSDSAPGWYDMVADSFVTATDPTKLTAGPAVS